MTNTTRAERLEACADELRGMAGDVESLITLADASGLPTCGLENARRELEWSARQFMNARNKSDDLVSQEKP